MMVLFVLGIVFLQSVRYSHATPSPPVEWGDCLALRRRYSPSPHAPLLASATARLEMVKFIYFLTSCKPMGEGGVWGGQRASAFEIAPCPPRSRETDEVRTGATIFEAKTSTHQKTNITRSENLNIPKNKRNSKRKQKDTENNRKDD